MKKIAVLVASMLLSLEAFAVDGVAVELGTGNATDMARIAAIWKMDRQWFTDGNWVVGGYWEAVFGGWQGRSNSNDNQEIVDLGLTPVFRLQQKTPEGFAPYLEGGSGPHILSRTYINADRKFSTALQFGTFVGIGARFGMQHQFDLSLRYQHLSNASIKQPNQGINFNQIRFAYFF